MTPSTIFRGRDVALFGLGGSGLATARGLMAGGARVHAWDDADAGRAKARQGGVHVADLRQADWKRFAAFVLSPGVPLTHPEPHWTVKLARARGVEIIGDIELFLRERLLRAAGAPFIAVTGTNGKSTTTALIAHILKSAGHDVQMGGNIGTAILSLQPPQHGRYHVVEMSSFQIDLTPSLEPTVGVMLNITADHIDRHGTLEHYAGVKQRLAMAGGTAVIGVDDDLSLGMAERREAAGRLTVRISAARALDGGVYFDNGAVYFARGGRISEIARLDGIGSLRGAHNGQNAAAALAVCLTLGVPGLVARGALATFPGLPHRMEEVGRRGKTLFINDSKATNADSAGRALLSFQNIHWIAGGKAKDGGIEPLQALFPRIAKAYLIGEAADQFASTLGKAGVSFMDCATLDVAVKHAADAAAAAGGDAVVLLSPACASYDQYKSFDERGNQFRQLVAKLDGMTVPKTAAAAQTGG